MPASPLVTVIVPGWNVAPYAAEALDSLRAQTLAAWRAVLVDDGSADGTGDVFARFAAQDDRFTHVTHPSQRGLGAARNTGLELVDTPYLGFFDSDDVMLPRALELLVGSLEATGSDIAVGQYTRLRPVDGGYAPSPVQPWVEASTAPARHGVTLAEHPEVTGNIVAWSKVSRTDLWRDHHVKFPQGLYEDQAVTALLYARARAIDTVAEPVVHWRVRAEGTSITQHEADPVVLAACLAALHDGLDILRREAPEVAARARIGQILRMDIPRLRALDLDAVSRIAVADFAAELTECLDD
ncbi:glycosyltransferase family 2 protein [Microbacterium paludicola]|uniref:Glycosyltransferase family 2 protein n=1 Tax=Microbacterium paludicola TaxID=300019 RepID=A0A4Y9FWA5_9MICO|nr:glycosyltransferase family 2 protein [Microbacterium paludicola]MBF0815717.1 glycosyltransferase family 2 protein [Microbacterium paludicola]TFU33556.1 glycosyltransferase family 2 protein [Microbacterium paludicola]